MLSLKTLSTSILLATTSLSMMACGKKDEANRNVKRKGKPSVQSQANQNRQSEEAARNRTAEEETRRTQQTQTTPGNPLLDEIPDNPVSNDDNTLSNRKKKKAKDDDANSTPSVADNSTVIPDDDDKDHINPKPNPEATRLSTEKVSEKQTDDTASTSVKTVSKACDDFLAQLSDLGWEKHDIEVLENPADEKSKKIQIAYYKQKGTQLNNPVFFMEGYFMRTRKAHLEAFNKIATTYKIDPILMDARGWGCSTAMPTLENLASWQYFAGRSYALDAEAIRKKELKDKKWKIWTHQMAGFAALRSVELVPNGISSIHITDFTPMKDIARFMLLRMEAQAEAWKDFVAYAGKEKGLLIADADITTAKNTLKEKWPCESGKSELCGENVFNVFAFLLRSNSEWNEAVDALESLMKGEMDKKDIIKNTVQNLQRAQTYLSPIRFIDWDQDASQTACSRALVAAEKNENLKKSPINSCKVEIALGQSQLQTIQKSLKYDPINFETIKKNLKSHKIDYYWMIADKSLFYPVKAAEEHYTEFKSFLKNNDLYHGAQDVEIYEDPEFLNSLKPEGAATSSKQ